MTMAPMEEFSRAMLDSFFIAMPHIKREEKKGASDPLGQKKLTTHLAQALPGGDSPR